MKLNAYDYNSEKVIIRDVRGEKIGGIVEFDTETCEAKIVVNNFHSGAVVINNESSEYGRSIAMATLKLPGAVAYKSSEDVLLDLPVDPGKNKEDLQEDLCKEMGFTTTTEAELTDKQKLELDKIKNGVW